MNRLLPLLLAFVATLAHAAPSWRDFPGVSNTSYVDPNGDRAIQLTIDVPAPQRAVFDAFTTSEGFGSWAAPVARVDLRTGGVIEASYDPDAKLGDPGNIRNAIVTFVAPRLLVIRNVQAPTDFVDRELFARTVTTIELQPLDEKTTRAIVTNTGYGPGPGFDALYEKFTIGNAYTLAALRKRFVDGPADWSKLRRPRSPGDAKP